MWVHGLKEKGIKAAAEGRGLWHWRRTRQREEHTGTHKENISPKSLAWKTRRTQFCEFLQPVDWLGVLKVSGPGPENPDGTALFLEKRQEDNPEAMDAMETAI